MDVRALVKNVKDYVIDLRREFHMYPERSGEEFRTSKRVKEELDKLGIPHTTAGGTGVVGIIKGEKPGKTVALRADMDALEVYEKTIYRINRRRMDSCTPVDMMDILPCF